MPGWKRIGLIALITGLCACATPRIELSDPGEISGKLMVFWDREDHFIYYPFYGDPLTYRLPRSVAEKVGVDTIRPGAIYTDGGSIPRAVRGVVGFSPWGYGPAYIVHDWLFVAHHCIRRDPGAGQAGEGAFSPTGTRRDLHSCRFGRRTPNLEQSRPRVVPSRRAGRHRGDRVQAAQGQVENAGRQT